MQRTNWANIFTWTRLISIIPLSVFASIHSEIVFVWVYVFAVLTDLIDGPLARMQGLANAKGADFDGSVDLVFTGVSLWWLWLLEPSIYKNFWPFLLIVLASFLAFFLVSQITLGKPVMPHLWSGKLAMALFSLLLPAILLFGVHAWFVHLVWVVAVVSRLEMIVYVLRGGKDMDVKSAFFR